MRRSILAALLACAVFTCPSLAAAQSSPTHYLSTASNNATLVKTGQVTLASVLAVNTTGTVYYLKLYNKATAPVCGTDVPKWTIPVPASGGVASHNIAMGVLFPLGLGFCLVAGIADNDNTAAVAGIAINFGLSGR